MQRPRTGLYITVAGSTGRLVKVDFPECIAIERKGAQEKMMNNYSGDNTTTGEPDGDGVTWSLLRFGLVILAGLILLLAPTSVYATARPDLVIISVLDPAPPGAEPGGGMFLQATVKTRGKQGPKAEVLFYLASDNVPGPDNVLIASVSVARFHGSDTVGVAVHVPAEVAPGFYYVLACAGTGSNCVASRGTIDIVGQALSEAKQTDTGVSATPTAKEYFPEDPAAGMMVGSPFDCPISLHGQFPSRCVWVTTKTFIFAAVGQVQSLMYCPISNPYPYIVALGFDPLWLDLSDLGIETRTNGISRTRYSSDIIWPQSYAGIDPTDPRQRGYAWFLMTNEHPFSIKGQAQFLCSDRVPGSTLP